SAPGWCRTRHGPPPRRASRSTCRSRRAAATARARRSPSRSPPSADHGGGRRRGAHTLAAGPTMSARDRTTSTALRAAVSSHASRTESVHVLLGAAGGVVGLGIGAVFLRGTAPLAGAGSIGQVAALSVFGCAAVTAAVVLSTLTQRSLPWFGGHHRWRRMLDVGGLSLVYGLLGLFLTGALFAVFQQAFQGVALDRMAETFWVAAASAAGAYIASASAA